MQVTQIYYEKVFPLAPYINEKVGVSISLVPGENEEQAFSMAKNLVNSWGTKIVEEHRAPAGQYATAYFQQQPPSNAFNPVQDKKADAEFEEFKKELADIPTREAAEEFLQKSSFKLSIEAKNLVNEKPTQEEILKQAENPNMKRNPIDPRFPGFPHEA